MDNLIGVSSASISFVGIELNKNGANLEIRYRKLIICEEGMLFKRIEDDDIVFSNSMMSEGGNSANAQQSKDTEKLIKNMISVGFKVLSTFGDNRARSNETLTTGDKPYSTPGVSA